MGCDIHMFVEYKRNMPTKDFKDRKDQWVLGDYFMRNPFNPAFEDEEEFKIIELYGDRDYTLFSTLAGVRDYSGKNEPVSIPKGLPEDCCEYVKKQNEKWGSDGHSHSWLTLKEIKDYQSQKPIITYSGLLSPTQLKELDVDGKTPNSWCQGTSLEGYKRREWNEPNKSLLPLIEKMEKRLSELFKNDDSAKDDEKIRIVFWFDN